MRWVSAGLLGRLALPKARRLRATYLRLTTGASLNRFKLPAVTSEAQSVRIFRCFSLLLCFFATIARMWAQGPAPSPLASPAASPVATGASETPGRPHELTRADLESF